jgi:hypothetical protein
MENPFCAIRLSRSAIKLTGRMITSLRKPGTKKKPTKNKLIASPIPLVRFFMIIPPDDFFYLPS